MPQRFQTGRHFDYGPTKSNSCQGRMVKQSLKKIIQAGFKQRCFTLTQTINGFLIRIQSYNIMAH